VNLYPLIAPRLKTCIIFINFYSRPPEGLPEIYGRLFILDFTVIKNFDYTDKNIFLPYKSLLTPSGGRAGIFMLII